MQELGEAPTAVVANDWVAPSTKWDVLLDLARQAPRSGKPRRPEPAHDRACWSERARRSPAQARPLVCSATTRSTSPNSSSASTRASSACRAAGTGKTYRGAHIAKALVAAGKRVGIMAMSHHAIDNFLEEIVKVFDADPRVELRAVRKVNEVPQDGLPGVTYVTNNSKLASDEFDIVAGTSWCFAQGDS